MNSQAVLAVIAYVVFWVVLGLGWLSGGLGPRAIIAFVALWLAAFVGVLRLPYVPFASITAVLDVVLVLMVFKGDVLLR